MKKYWKKRRHPDTLDNLFKRYYECPKFGSYKTIACTDKSNTRHLEKRHLFCKTSLYNFVRLVK